MAHFDSILMLGTNFCSAGTGQGTINFDSFQRLTRQQLSVRVLIRLLISFVCGSTVPVPCPYEDQISAEACCTQAVWH